MATSAMEGRKMHLCWGGGLAVYRQIERPPSLGRPMVAELVKLVVTEEALVLPLYEVHFFPIMFALLLSQAVADRALPHFSCMPLEFLRKCTLAQQEH